MPLAVHLSITRMPGSVLGVLLRLELLAHACTGSVDSASPRLNLPIPVKHGQHCGR